MIVHLKNFDDFIYAYIEFEIVDYDTKICDDGLYCYIQNIWIHENYRNNGCLSKLIKMVFSNSKNAEFVYWYRNKKGKDSGIILGSKFLKYIKEPSYGTR